MYTVAESAADSGLALERGFSLTCACQPTSCGSAQLIHGTKVGPGCPAGFATLKTLLVTPELKQGGINVFGRPSGKQSIFLKIKVRPRTPYDRFRLIVLIQPAAQFKHDKSVFFMTQPLKR
jgi:hypothetical protein